MKILNKIFLSLSLFSLILCSCEESKQQKDARQIQDRQEQSETEKQSNVDNQRIEEQRKIEQETNTFNTAKGTFNIDKTINSFYEHGLSLGPLDKSEGLETYGSEDYFKIVWLQYYGVPSNDKAKDVYNRCLQKYLDGYKEGYNF